MAKINRCFVEVLFIEDNFVSFDFGKFAIVVVRESVFSKIYVCVGDNYTDYFMSFIEDVDRQICSEESLQITLRDFKEAELIAKERKKSIVLGKAWKLVRRVFPGYASLFVS